MKASDIKVGEAYYHARGITWRLGQGFQVGRFVPASEPHHGKVTGALAYGGQSAPDVSVTTVRTGDLRGPYDEVVVWLAERAAERVVEADRIRAQRAELDREDDTRAARLDALGVEYQRERPDRGGPRPTREGLDRLLKFAEIAERTR